MVSQQRFKYCHFMCLKEILRLIEVFLMWLVKFWREFYWVLLMVK